MYAPLVALVCGGRSYWNQARLWHDLDRVDLRWGIRRVIQGKAPGADSLAALWAKSRDKECWGVEADWDRHGLSAGPIRNQLMLDMHKPEIVIAFPGGSGTQDMVERSLAQGFWVVDAYRDLTPYFTRETCGTRSKTIRRSPTPGSVASPSSQLQLLL